MKNLTLFISISLSSLCLSQNWQWVNHLDGGGTHSYYDITVNKDSKSIYAVGRYRASAIFYGQDSNIVYPPHAGSRDAFITKIDTSGNYLWVNTEGGPETDYGFGVTSDEFDNAYMVGIVSDTAYFGTQQLISPPNYTSAYVAKYSPDGDLIWAKNWKSDATVWGTKITSDKNGHIYITGFQSGNFDYGTGVLIDKGFFIGKLDYSGNFIWCKGPENGLATNTFSRGEALYFHNNFIYLGGSYTKQVSFGNTMLTTPGNLPNIFFAKLDSNGVFQWVREVSSINKSGCRDILVTDMTIYIVGAYSGTAIFDTISVFSDQFGTTSSQANNSQDGYIAKYNTDGSSCYWVREQKGLYSDKTYSVLVNNLNNIVTSGTYAYNNSANSSDLRITEYTPNGTVNWEHTPSGDYISSSLSIEVDKDNNYYTAGSIRGTHNFVPNTTILANELKSAAIIGRLYPPITSYDSTLSICSTDSIYFNIENNNGSPLTYNWFSNTTNLNTDNDSVLISPYNMDSIWCIVSNNGDSDTVTFYINENSFSFSLGNDSTTCSYNTSITLNSPTNYNSYTWSTGENTSSIVITQTDEYWLTVTNLQNCSFTDTIQINYLDCAYLEENKKPSTIQYYQNKQIEILSDLQNYYTDIYSISGQLIIRSKNQKIISLKNLNKGIYIIKLIGTNTSESKKISIY